MISLRSKSIYRQKIIYDKLAAGSAVSDSPKHKDRRCVCKPDVVIPWEWSLYSCMHEAFTLCWLNVGPASRTVVRQCSSTGSMPDVKLCSLGYTELIYAYHAVLYLHWFKNYILFLVQGIIFVDKICWPGWCLGAVLNNQHFYKRMAQIRYWGERWGVNVSFSSKMLRTDDLVPEKPNNEVRRAKYW